MSSHESVIIVKTEQLAKKIEIGAHTDYTATLKVHLLKETMYGKNRPLEKPEPILFFSANSKGNTFETFSFLN
jgi:hypothetical protein